MDEIIQEELKKLFDKPETNLVVRFKALDYGYLEMVSYDNRGKQVHRDVLPFIRQAEETMVGQDSYPRIAKGFGGYSPSYLPDDWIDEYTDRMKSKKPKKDFRNRSQSNRRGKLSKMSSFEIKQGLKKAILALDSVFD